MTSKEEVGRWLTIVANFSVVAGILFLAVELHQNNELLEQQARYVHLQNRLEGNEHLISDEAFRQAMIKATVGSPLSESEYEQIVFWHLNTYLKWEWELEQYRASDLDQIPVHGWSGYIRRYPLALEAWSREKSSLTPEFVRFFEETLIPASEQAD